MEITQADEYKARTAEAVEMPSGAVFKIRKTPPMAQIAGLNALRRVQKAREVELEKKAQKEGGQVAKSELELIQIDMEQDSQKEIYKIAHGLIIEPKIEWESLEGQDQIFLINKVSEFINKMSENFGENPEKKPSFHSGIDKGPTGTGQPDSGQAI